MNTIKGRWLRSTAWILGLGGSFYAVGWLHGQYSATGKLKWESLTLSIWRSQPNPDSSVEHGHSHGGSAEDTHAGHDHSTSVADAHDAHGHKAHRHDQHDSLELSDSAKKNIGLTDEFLQPIELKSFQRSIAVPAIVVDRPGRTRLPVSAPMTGIVTHVHAVAGEAVQPGDLLIEMRLTHEDLVTAQREYLQALGDLEIEEKEISRLEQLANTGALSNKTFLERQYSRDKIQSLLRSQREALRLHGLSEEQIETINSKRKLLTEMRIVAPGPDDHEHDEIQLSQSPRFATSRVRYVVAALDGKSGDGSDDTSVLVLQDLLVQKGQIVNAGQLLGTLADYDQLLLEGQAFENESHLVTRAKQENQKTVAVLEESGNTTRLEDLKFGWIDNQIDPQTRTLKFYIELPNTLIQDSKNASGQRFATWRYRTGQRMQLLVPIEQWIDQIVLPIDAVSKEGPDCFVFQQNGNHFDRVAVHEIYRDQTSVVIESDGSIYPGDVVALRGAHQMQMAIKNKTGGGVDPHAGHSH